MLAASLPMHIGIVSDTHNHLRNVSRIVDLFANAVGLLDLVSLGTEILEF